MVESYLYDADGQRIKKTVTISNTSITTTTTFFISPLFEKSGATTTKYYYFNGQRVAMRINGVLQYLHADHLGSTVLTTNAASGSAIIGDEGYLAYGRNRRGNGVPTDFKFTGQKQDGSGLQYFNSRYYDPQLGTFISPDTIVPDATNPLAYNRLMYVLGNPMRLADPTGYYSQSEIQEHFACGEDWNCVLAYFQEGGSYAGLWGWLQVLLTAQDGDIVSSASVLQDSNGLMASTSLQGIFGRNKGKIAVNNVSFIATDGSTSSFAASLPEFALAQFAIGARGLTNAAYGNYGLVTQSMSLSMMPDSPSCGTPIDCTGIMLDMVSVGAGTLSLACGPGAPACAAGFGYVSSGATGVGVYRTVNAWWNGDTSGGSLATTTALAVPSAPKIGNPKVSLVAGLIQLIVDVANSMGD